MREAENLSIGLGGGFRAGLEGTKQLLTQPVATARALVEAARQVGTDPRIVLDMLRAARQKAMSGSLGLGELIGENLTPGVRGKTPNVRKIFVGKGSKTWDATAAKRAEELEAQGVSPEEIWQQTGTFRSPDGQLRQEISDASMIFKKDVEGTAPRPIGEESYFPELIQHAELAGAYPMLKNTEMDVRVSPTIFEQGAMRSHFPTESEIKYLNKEPKFNAMIWAKTTDEALNTIVHEFQHAVQHIEGFSRGSDPQKFLEIAENQLKKNREFLSKPKAEQNDLINKLADKMYKMTAGETEARAAASRRTMTPQQRKATFPLKSYDVPINELTFK